MTDLTTITKAEARASGAKHYFTGLACKRGHTGPRFVSCGGCVDCSNEKSKRWHSDRERSATKRRRWRLANPEKEALNRKLWRERNPEKAAAADVRYLEKHPDGRKEICKRWYGRNLQAQRQRSVDYRNQNIEERRSYNRDYNKKNKPKLAAHSRNRRARQRAGGRHTEADVIEIFFAQRGRCGYCRVKLGGRYHVDHITALANGGTNDRRNLQILCVPCNKSKSAKDPIDFAQSRGMLL